MKEKKIRNISEDNEIQYIFPILSNCEDGIMKNNYINENDIYNIENNTKRSGLLIAPAGSGKTTAIVNQALNNKDNKTRALLVPTTVICEQLEMKYKDNEKIVFLHGKAKPVNLKKRNPKLIIMIYDQYNKIKDDEDIILYIDEAHEFNSFKSINDKKCELLQNIQFSDNKKIFVTATPLNLANIFDYKIMFKGNINKNIFIYQAREIATIRSKFIDMINSFGKTLVYINNEAEIDQIIDYIKDVFPFINICKITSNSKDNNEEYERLLNNEILVSDIVFTTKLLNIGFDIQGVFRDVVYLDKKLDLNACFQLLNRERQFCNFHLFTRDSDNTLKFEGLNNWDYKINMNTQITNNNLNIFDKHYTKNGDFDFHLQVNKFYGYINASFVDFINFGEILYGKIFNKNINNISEIKNDKYVFKVAQPSRIKKQANELLAEFSVYDIYNSFLKDNTLKLLNNSYKTNKKTNLNKTLINNLRYILNLFEYTIICEIGYINDEKRIELLAEIMEDYITPENLMFLGNSFKIKTWNNFINSDDLDDNIKELSNVMIDKDTIIDNEMKNIIIEKLNLLEIYYENNEWTTKNFKNNFESLTGFRLDNSGRQTINGERIRVLKNKTVIAEDLQEDFKNNIIKKCNEKGIQIIG